MLKLIKIINIHMTFDPKTSKRTHEFSTNASQAMSELVSKQPHSKPGIMEKCFQTCF